MYLSLRRALALAASVGTAFTATSAIMATPSALASAPSPVGISFYLGGADTTKATNAGCQVGNLTSAAGQQKLTSIIGFGAPRANGGASNWSYPDFTSSQIQNLTTSFINGFMYCANIAGDSNSILNVVPTTNNDSNANTSSAHGSAWATMVVALQAAVNTNGWGARVQVLGGMDVEPAFNATVANTKAWVSGFIGVAGMRFVGNNSLDGCPYSGGEYTATTTCAAPSTPNSPAWKVDDLWFVAGQSTDTSMKPVPQIYNSNQAQQWFRLAKYTKSAKGYKMYFLNTMTTVGACSQVGGCSGLSPNAAYDALQNLLNSNSAVTVTIEGDTDVKWV